MKKLFKSVRIRFMTAVVNVEKLIYRFRVRVSDWIIPTVTLTYIQNLEENVEHLSDRVHNTEVQLRDINKVRQDALLIRENNPAVNDAWEQYQIMMKLHL